jgi:hypothetical protein
LNRGSGGPAGRFEVGVVFVGATEVGGVADDAIEIWDISSADATAVDVAVGAVSNVNTHTYFYSAGKGILLRFAL